MKVILKGAERVQCGMKEVRHWRILSFLISLEALSIGGGRCVLWYVLRVHCIDGTTIFPLLFLEHANVTVGGREEGRKDLSPPVIGGTYLKE